jgi:hypothetical protein
MSMTRTVLERLRSFTVSDGRRWALDVRGRGSGIDRRGSGSLDHVDGPR